MAPAAISFLICRSQSEYTRNSSGVAQPGFATGSGPGNACPDWLHAGSTANAAAHAIRHGGADVIIAPPAPVDEAVSMIRRHRGCGMCCTMPNVVALETKISGITGMVDLRKPGPRCDGDTHAVRVTRPVYPRGGDGMFPVWLDVNNAA